MSKYLVTGGLGVVGSCFAEEMLEAGHDVVILDAAEEERNRWTGARMHRDYNMSGRTRMQLAVERMEDCDLAPFLDVDFILHAAASTGIPHSEKDPDDDWRSNVDATKNLLDSLRDRAARGLPVPPTVCLSSVKPYSTKNVGVGGVNETAELEPDEPYAASKMAMSGMCMAWARSFNLPVVVYRMSNLYGPGPCHGPRHGWLTWLCICAAIGRPFEVQGGGTVRRDMLFTTDITQSVLRGFAHMDALRGNVYNVGGGAHNVTSVARAAEYVRKLVPELVLTEGPGRRFEDEVFFTDHSRFSRATGWTPTVSVWDGIGRIVQWAQLHAGELRDLYRNV